MDNDEELEALAAELADTLDMIDQAVNAIPPEEIEIKKLWIMGLIQIEDYLTRAGDGEEPDWPPAG